MGDFGEFEVLVKFKEFICSFFGSRQGRAIVIVDDDDSSA